MKDYSRLQRAIVPLTGNTQLVVSMSYTEIPCSQKVLLADAAEVVRRGIKLMLHGNGEFLIAGEACNFGEAVEETADLKSDLIVIDLHLFVGNSVRTQVSA